MRFDLMAGTAAAPRAPLTRAPVVLVFDSGLGGLTVLAEVRRARPDARVVYAADDAAFPYGGLAEPVLVARVLAVMERLIASHTPDLVVVACNTASTLVLPALRQRFDIPFVGTVPPIKPAAAATRSGLVSVLATPGTVKRDYTRDLIETYAAGCAVTLVGATGLAALAEAALSGLPVSDADLRAEIGPCFVEGPAGRTDVVVLACTHYPLLLARYQAIAPWPVTWIDPAPAIARRMTQLIGGPVRGPGDDGPGPVLAAFTSGDRLTPALRAALGDRGIAEIALEAVPLVLQ
ncbi:glutamate racemase [Methylobacterium platani]|uniref:Glutamate racemase n=2 Tax=Methylobacterium platani TaxID=427683 RepID=A0A179SII1_9HYPH|nr:glutamate racemase [Methylobacterium platani]KMO18574.1 glutamate racemase [Methylobacterium platani JCM 14648]OAS26810.1 glutamate racemase [Methylobacterium platani]